MGITVVNNESELNAWAAARFAQASYTEDEWAEIPAGVTISINGDFGLDPVNAGAFVAGIRPQSGGGITGRLWPIYGTRATIALRDFSSFTIRGKGRVRGVQVTRTQSGGGLFRLGGGARYEQCIIDAGSLSGQNLIGAVSGGGKCVACLLVASPASGRLVNAEDDIQLERCTAVANGHGGAAFRSDFGGLRLVGTAVIGFSSDLTGSLAAGSTHNATSNGTALGTSGQTGLASGDFVNTTSGSEDYALASGSAKLRNTGTTISGVTVDLFGLSIPQGAAPDIGATEFEEASGPVITGPTTFNLAENQTAGPVFSTDIDLGSGFPSLTGPDAGLFSLVSVGTRQWRVTKAVGGNFEGPDDAGANGVYDVTFNASASVSRACAITLTNVAEPPGAPTIGTATAGDATVTINGTAPAANGGPSVTSYTATLSPGGLVKSGATLPITLTSAEGVVNGTAYTGTLTATNSEGPGPASAASNAVTPSSASVAPSVTTQPSNASVTAPTAASFTAAASGTPTPTVQWQRNPGGTGSWANVSGSTSGTLTTGATSESGGSWNNGDQVRAVFTNSQGTATSNAATLTVTSAPPPPSGLSLSAVKTDATGSAEYLNAATRLIIEPLGNIENWGAGSRTISTTVTASNGLVTLPVLPSGRYSVLQIFPATGPTVTGVAMDIVTVP